MATHLLTAAEARLYTSHGDIDGVLAIVQRTVMVQLTMIEISSLDHLVGESVANIRGATYTRRPACHSTGRFSCRVAGLVYTVW